MLCDAFTFFTLLFLSIFKKKKNHFQFLKSIIKIAQYN